VIAFAAIGLIRLPLLWVIAVLAPLSFAIAGGGADDLAVLVELALQFLVLSLLSIAARTRSFPRSSAPSSRALDDHADFAQMFALSQAAPGPNVLIVSLIGWKAAGVAGSVVAMASMCAPSSLLTYQVARVWEAFATRRCGSPSRRRWRDHIGLILASASAHRTIDQDWRDFAVTGPPWWWVMTTRWHPLWMLARRRRWGGGAF